MQNLQYSLAILLTLAVTGLHAETLDMPAEAMPAEAMPAEAMPAEAMPAEAMPAEAMPAEAMPAKAMPAEAMPAEAMPDTAKPIITINPDLPTRGMDMVTIEEQFGTPIRKTAAVGEPPISRWEYDGFTVYFEHQYALHSVDRSEIEEE